MLAQLLFCQELLSLRQFHVFLVVLKIFLFYDFTLFHRVFRLLFDLKVVTILN